MFPLVRLPILERMQHLEKIDVQDRKDGTGIFIQFPDEPGYELFTGGKNCFSLPGSGLGITIYRVVLGEVDRVVGVSGVVTHKAMNIKYSEVLYETTSHVFF